MMSFPHSVFARASLGSERNEVRKGKQGKEEAEHNGQGAVFTGSASGQPSLQAPAIGIWVMFTHCGL